MKESLDPYWKLRAPLPTPADEICSCSGSPPVILMGRLSYNPLACLVCNGEVPPEKVGYDVRLSDSIGDWNTLYRAFETLWLDSGEFEALAEEQLRNPCSEVNRRGRQLVQELNNFRRTYYMLYGGCEADADYVPPADCPVCKGPIARTSGKYWWWVCESCSITLSR